MSGTTGSSFARRWSGGASALAINAALAAAGVLGFSGAALAQEAESQSLIPQINVTAEFRSENLQNTPIAITAVNAAMLDARSQTNVQDITAQAPNVTLKANGQAFGSSLVAFIRGVGQTDFNFASEPGVGVYVDDVYYATITGNLLDLLDLDRVEVLRGPQGTLAGKNSIGGAIKLFTRKPDGEGGGFVEGTYGSFDRVDIKAGADFAIVPDSLFVRFSGVSRSRDGYVTRLDYACSHPGLPGSTLPQLNVGQDCKIGTEGGQSYTAGRVAFRWLASDNFEINANFDMVDDRSEVQGGVLIDAVSGVSAVPIFYDNNHDGCFNSTAASGCTVASADGDVAYDTKFVTHGPHAGDPRVTDPYVSYANYIDDGQNPAPFGCTPVPPFASTACKDYDHYKPVVVPPINHFKGWGMAATVDWNVMENLQIKWISSYRYYTNIFANDDDASPLAVQELLQTLTHHQWSQEVRVNGAFFDNWLQYTFGGFYQDQTGTLHARVDLPYTAFDFIHGPDPTPSNNNGGCLILTAHPTDQLTLAAGTRFSEDEKTYTFHRHNPDGSPIPASDECTGAPWFFFVADNCAVAGAGGISLDGLSARFASKRWDYRFAANYDWTPNFMTYIQLSTGYKGGGIDARPFVPDQAIPFAPETLTAYEIGFKSTLFERIRLNAAYFFNVYKAIQLIRTDCSANSASATCLQPFNGGDAHVSGFELETEIHPTEALEFDASISTLDFEYQRISSLVAGITLNMITPYTPELKWSIGAQYEFTLPAQLGTLTPRIDASYQSEVYALATNAASNLIDGYTVANARVTWRSEDHLWEFAGAVTNLFDEYYYLTINDLIDRAGFTSGQPGRPREFAISVKRKF